MSTILITGSTGFVGNYIASTIKNTREILTPSRSQLDIRSNQSTDHYIQTHRPSVIIHAAAATDATNAETERGDIQAPTWQTNVEGTQNILHAANDIGAFVITLSTGSVFAGSARKKHDTTVPQFSESTKVVLAPDRMSWYGYTKAEAESFITNESPMRHAIIRLSHPVGPEESLCHHDYLHTLTHLFKTKTLFPLFSDQQFAITYLPDLMKLLTFLIQTNRPGIYHPVSPDTTTPYDLVSYTLQQSNMRVSDLKTIPLATFLSTHRTPLRFDPSIHLMNNETEKITNIHFLPWKAMVENIL